MTVFFTLMASLMECRFIHIEWINWNCINNLIYLFCDTICPQETSLLQVAGKLRMVISLSNYLISTMCLLGSSNVYLNCFLLCHLKCLLLPNVLYVLSKSLYSSSFSYALRLFQISLQLGVPNLTYI